MVPNLYNSGPAPRGARKEPPKGGQGQGEPGPPIDMLAPQLTRLLF